MRTHVRVLVLALCATAGYCQEVKPDEESPTPAGYTWKHLQFTGLADVYFENDFNHPGSHQAQLRFFDYRTGQLALSMLKLGIEKSDSVFGFRVDVGTGQAFRAMHAFDPAPRGFRYFEQMYLSAKPKSAHGLEIDIGQFVGPATAEVVETNSNWNYSRSLIFSWATPTYHMGLRATVPVTKELNVGVMLVNGWNNLWNEPKFQTGGLNASWTKKHYSLAHTFYDGRSNQGMRKLNDTVLAVTPNARVNASLTADCGRLEKPSGPTDRWFAAVLGAHVQVASKIAVSPRIGWYSDRGGATTGMNQILKVFTLTGEYQYSKRYLSRLEFRHDQSSQPFYDYGAQSGASRSMNTLTLGVIAVLTPAK